MITGQALGVSANDERDRIGFREDPAPEFTRQGLRYAEANVIEDLQDGDEHREILEAAARLPAARAGHRKSAVQGR